MAKPGLDKHPKFKKLMRLTGEPRPYLRGYLECMWEVGYEYGDPVLGDPTDVEHACDYPRDDGKLFEALLKCGLAGGAGFIEECPDRPGCYQIHDLYHNAPDYVQKRRAREILRKSKIDGENGGQRRTTADADRTPADNGAVSELPTATTPPCPSLPESALPESALPLPSQAKSERADARKSAPKFQPPSVEDVRAYCQERGNSVDPETFVNHYTANGWKVGGRAAMKDWRAAVCTWEKNGVNKAKPPPGISQRELRSHEAANLWLNGASDER